MKEEGLQSLGPWSGINNIADASADAFQPGDGRTPALRDAVNVDLLRDGWLKRRDGYIRLATCTDAHSATSVGGMFLYVDAGDLKRMAADGTTSAVAASVGDAPMSYAEAGGSVYYCNGLVRGRIPCNTGLATFWGLDNPGIPLLEATTGGLPAGDYQVALTCEADDGTESGAHRSATISLPNGGGVLVSQLTHDANAPYINTYMTAVNGDLPYWSNRIDSSDATATIVGLPQSSDAIDVLMLFPPPAGADAVYSFKGRLLVTVGNTLYWSQPLAYHLFKPSTDVQLFAEPITMVATVDDGFYVAEGERTWWVSGDDPDTWSPTLADPRSVATGTVLHVPGRKLPSLQTTAMVCVWMTTDGIVAGMPGGRLAHLNEKTVAVDGYDRSSLVYREKDGLAQILCAMKSKNAANRFAATDVATISVVRHEPA